MPHYRSLVPGGFFSSDPTNLEIKRSIRTNNPSALVITTWQQTFPGFVGETLADADGNKTTIYVTPEHGVAAWFHLLTVRYAYGEHGKIEMNALARRYAGMDSDDAPDVRTYLAGWRKWSGNMLDKASTIDFADNDQVLVLARAMFCHEIGGPSPLLDSQITAALRLKRNGGLPPA